MRPIRFGIGALLLGAGLMLPTASPAAAQSSNPLGDLSDAFRVLDPTGVLGGLGGRGRSSDYYGRGNGGYYGGGYGYGRGGGRRELQARTNVVEDRLRQAERDRRITRRDADDFRDRIRRVRDFLRNDRELTSDEYNRRDDDLRDIEQDLDRRIGRAYGYTNRYGYGDNGRYNDRYNDPYYRGGGYSDPYYRGGGYNDPYYRGRYDDRYDRRNNRDYYRRNR